MNNKYYREIEIVSQKEKNMSSISLLHPSIRYIINKIGWSTLTPIQEKAIPAILSGADVLISAPTGEGKTEAALLPLFSIIQYERDRGIEPEALSILYVTPMKALINNLYYRIKLWADELNLIVARKHGDTSASERSRRLREKPHILIITPESLEIDLDWAQRIRALYKNIRWVIVDEVHELLSGKRGAQFLLQLERLTRLAKRDIQRIGLSATIGDPKRTLEVLAGSSKRKRLIVSVPLAKKPELKVIYVSDKRGNVWKRVGLNLKKEIEKPSLVFVNSRYVAERIKDTLENLEVNDVFVHHSSVSPELRHEAEERLRRGELSAIVCTKTLEVGIDIGSIKKVIQIKSPGRPSSLLQRIGRSGHRRGESPRGSIIAIGDLDYLESIAIADLAVKASSDDSSGGVSIEDTTLKRIPLDVIAKVIQGILLQSKNSGNGLVDRNLLYSMVAAHPLVKKYFDLNKFNELIDYMIKLGVIREEEGNLRLGSTFYSIWKFRNGSGGRKLWWTRDFSEFFSTISDRDSFIVKSSDKTVGFVDSLFVYRFLRPGDVIRLAGRAWRIVRIEENLAKIEVVPSDGEGEIPLWRGEAARRPLIVAERLAQILSDSNPLDIKSIRFNSKKLNELLKIYKNILNKHNKNFIIYEIYNYEHIFTIPLGSGANEALALLLVYLASNRMGLNVYYRSMFMGFSVYIGELNPIELIMNIDLDKLDDYFDKAVERSPYLYQVIREIQLSFGKRSSIDFEEDRIIVEEAKQQVKEDYLDIESAKKFIKMMKENKIKIIAPHIAGLTPIAMEILKMPQVKPWIPDLAGRIAKLIDETALTVLEIADILELAEKTVEAKIKEMRRSDYDEERRVVSFIDIDEDEWRYTLLKSIEKISKSEEFAPSFTPTRLDDPIRVVIWHTPGVRGAGKEIILTPRVVREEWEAVEAQLPEEIYKVKVVGAYDYGGRNDASVTFYHVPKSVLKYLLLNAAAYLEEKRRSEYWW